MSSAFSATSQALWRRAGLVWLCHVGVLLFLFTLIAKIGLRTDRRAIKNLISFYLEEPIDALWTGLVMIYNPPLLDILPMYILFMALSPLLLVHGVRQGWAPILVASIALWIVAQFGFGNAVYTSLLAHAKVRLPPYEQTGSFSLVAWQFL